MSTKFFTNSTGNTLFDKFKGIAADMINFDSFLAVVGFFRSSGYFKSLIPQHYYKYNFLST